MATGDNSFLDEKQGSVRRVSIVWLGLGEELRQLARLNGLLHILLLCLIC